MESIYRYQKKGNWVQAVQTERTGKDIDTLFQKV